MSIIFCNHSFKWLFLSFVISPLLLFAESNDVYLYNLLNKKYDGVYLSKQQIDSAFQSVADKDTTQTPRYSVYFEKKHNCFRRSFYATYYAIDAMRKDTFAISNDEIRDAVLSPNNKYVVYGKKDGNLYIAKLDFRTEVAITHDTFPLVNGVSEWLYEEEFETTTLFSFSPDAKYIAFVKLNLSDMQTFHWLTYNDSILYPALHSLTYPKVNTPNPIANVYVYDIYYKTIRHVKIDKKEGDYFPYLAWRKINAKQNEYNYELVVEKINRDQNCIIAYGVNPKSQESKIIYKEESNNFFVDYSLFKNSVFLDDGRWITLSEKEGWCCLYLLSENSLQSQRLTPPNMDVTKICGVDEKEGNVYFQAAPFPTTRQVYSYNLKTKKLFPISNDNNGWYDLYLSPSKEHYILSYESNNTPIKYTLFQKRNHKYLQSVFDNTAVFNKWVNDKLPSKEFFSFITPLGDTLYGWIIKPIEMGKNKSRNHYPVVVMQYGGPNSQRVIDKWAKRFGHYLASIGYVVACVDGRGTGGRGRNWRNTSYLHLGDAEAQDQLYTAQYLKTLPFIDTAKMAICGWSYGGFVTLKTLMTQNAFAQSNKLSHPPYKCGIAIAPVTDWHFYDSGYTERYMRTLGLNENNYTETSLLDKVHLLSGNLLLVHALADDNVHFQHSALLIDALNKAGKMYDLQIYPNDNHSIKQETNRTHLHKKIIKFLNDNLY